MHPSSPAIADQALTFLVTGMSCGHCGVAVIDQVSRVAGVSAIDVELESKFVHVHGTDVDEKAVAAAVDEAGYEAVQA
jgi:copper chaperone CopZ